jgi:hypothetical protein
VQRQAGDRAVLLTYDGQGHAAYLRGQCMTNAVNDYILTGTTAAPRTHCPAEPIS